MLGSLAKHREKEIVEWALDNEMVVLSVEAFLRMLYKDDERFDFPPNEVVMAYTVAFRDLRRKQILKGIGGPKGGAEDEYFTLNNLDRVKAILEGN